MCFLYFRKVRKGNTHFQKPFIAEKEINCSFVLEVIWTVLEEEVTIAQSLLNKFVTVKDLEDLEPLKYTARDAMPLNERKVSIKKRVSAGERVREHTSACERIRVRARAYECG